MNDFREYSAAFADHQDDLCHYASKYYDPVKAHAYYMKHRKLKGGNHYIRKANVFSNFMNRNNSESSSRNNRRNPNAFERVASKMTSNRSSSSNGNNKRSPNLFERNAASILRGFGSSIVKNRDKDRKKRRKSK